MVSKSNRKQLVPTCHSKIVATVNVLSRTLFNLNNHSRGRKLTLLFTDPAPGFDRYTLAPPEVFPRHRGTCSDPRPETTPLRISAALLKHTQTLSLPH